MNLRLYLCAIAVALSLDVEAAWAQLSGHGGPVRALAISADGKSVLSGSFDTSVIRWSLATESAEQVLRFHSDAVNAVVFLQDGRMATAGADARTAIWTAGRQQPDEVFEGHRAPIASLAVSPDGSMLASDPCHVRYCSGFWTPGNDERRGRLSWPASKKRQGTKSREVGHWLAASAMGI